MIDSSDKLIATLLESGDGMDAEDFKDVSQPAPFSEVRRFWEDGILVLSGDVTRDRGCRYSHERSTTFNLDYELYWPDSMDSIDQEREEQRIGSLVSELEKTISERIVDWNHKIYRELEREYENATSDEAIADHSHANGWTYDEDGNLGDGELTFNQLGDAAKDHARSRYAEHMDLAWMQEPVYAEWRWLLHNKGFDNVEFAWSGFWSQGDGASFTAKSVDFKRYFEGPDPLEFPETEREQMDESLDDSDLKDVSLPATAQNKAIAIEAALSQVHDITNLTCFGMSASITNAYYVAGNMLGNYGEVYDKLRSALRTSGFDPSIKGGVDIAITFLAADENYPREFIITVKTYDQVAENHKDDDPVKDVAYPPEVPRKNITHITTQSDYEEFKRRIADFIESWGKDATWWVCRDEWGTPISDNFTSQPCECCKRPLAGSRVRISTYAQGVAQPYFWICNECEYYLEYGTLDDQTMAELKPDPLVERYGGAEQERGIWYHGTSASLIPKILTQGLVPNPKKRVWPDHEDTSSVQATRKSLPGIYVTNSLPTATGAALRAAQMQKPHANQAVVVMELQPRTMVADEDSVNFCLKSVEAHLNGSPYHHIWYYFMDVYGDRCTDERYHDIFKKQKQAWVEDTYKRLTYSFGEIDEHLKTRIKEMLFSEGFRVMLARNVAYVEGWDRTGNWKSEWSKGFGTYDDAPPIPDPEQAEEAWLAFSDKLARTFKDKARPAKNSTAWNNNGRVREPIGFSGSNRIICIAEISRDTSVENWRSQMVVHYGKPPEKLIRDWNEAIGDLKESDIVYQRRPTQESDDDHNAALNATGYWGKAGAGGIFIASDTGRILLGLRSGQVLQPGTWGTFGGAVDSGEAPKVAAEREMREETGFTGPLKLASLHIFRDKNFSYHNFAAVVANEFEPALNWENDEARWFSLTDLPAPLHFGLKDLLAKSKAKIERLVHPIAESDDTDLKDLGGPVDPQNWNYRISRRPTCMEIAYYLDRNPYAPVIAAQLFPKNTGKEDLDLTAEAQIRQFHRTGYYDPDNWRNVWEWMKYTRLGIEPPPEPNTGDVDYAWKLAQWKKTYNREP